MKQVWLLLLIVFLGFTAGSSQKEFGPSTDLRALQSFTSYQINDCGACLQQSTSSIYCYNTVTNVEWCCSPGDTSINCTPSGSVTCAPPRSIAGDLSYTYCNGASSPTACGVNSLELTATGTWRNVSVPNFPAYSYVSGYKTYQACYYHLKAVPYTWMDGAKLYIFVNQAYDVVFEIFGGNSRTNASIATSLTNISYSSGSLIYLDVSEDAIVLVRPRDYRLSPVNFQFSFGIQGSAYPWYQQYIIGPNGNTYFIVAVSIASLMAALLILAIVLGIVHCLKPHLSDQPSNKVQDISQNDSEKLRNPTYGGYDGTKLPDDISISLPPPPYGNQSSFNPNDVTQAGPPGSQDQQPRPVIRRVNNDNYHTAVTGEKVDLHIDLSNMNPFLPSNIQKNKANNNLYN